MGAELHLVGAELPPSGAELPPILWLNYPLSEAELQSLCVLSYILLVLNYPLLVLNYHPLNYPLFCQ